MAGKLRDFLHLSEHDRFREIFSQTAHFDVAGLADDDREIAGADQFREPGVRMPNERTGPIRDIQSRPAPHFAPSIGDAMRGDHDFRAWDRVRSIETIFRDAFFPQALADDGVVDQFAEDRERSGRGQGFGLGDGVAHPETHPEIFGQ